MGEICGRGGQTGRGSVEVGPSAIEIGRRRGEEAESHLREVEERLEVIDVDEEDNAKRCSDGKIKGKVSLSPDGAEGRRPVRMPIWPHLGHHMWLMLQQQPTIATKKSRRSWWKELGRRRSMESSIGVNPTLVCHPGGPENIQCSRKVVRGRAWR